MHSLLRNIIIKDGTAERNIKWNGTEKKKQKEKEKEEEEEDGKWKGGRGTRRP